MTVDRRTILGAAGAASLLAACGGGGGGGSSPAKTSMEIVPALGAIFNAPVFLWASGNPQPLGNVLTDGTTGKATISFDAPASGSAFFSRCTVGPGSSFFDEGVGRVIQVGPSAVPVELFAVKTSSSAPMAISPLTNMVAKLAGVDSASVSSPTFSITNDKIVNSVSL